MTALVCWIIAGALCITLVGIGLPPVLVVLIASPFATMAGWSLIRPAPSHVCGWCGRRFGGAYEWCCPDCEGEMP